MKIVGLILFVSIFEVFGQSTRVKPEKITSAQIYYDDLYTKGQSNNIKD